MRQRLGACRSRDPRGVTRGLGNLHRGDSEAAITQADVLFVLVAHNTVGDVVADNLTLDQIAEAVLQTMPMAVE